MALLEATAVVLVDFFVVVVANIVIAVVVIAGLLLSITLHTGPEGGAK